MNSEPAPAKPTSPLLPPTLRDPSFLDPFESGGKLQVVIETPKGSRNEYAFDYERK